MSNYIVDLIGIALFEAIFPITFFLGLLFTIYIIFGALHGGEDSHSDSDHVDGDHDITGHDVDHDVVGHDFDHDMHLDADHSLEVDHDISLDADHDLGLDHDMSLDADHDLSVDHDFDFDGDFADVQVEDIYDMSSFRNRSKTLKSNFMMGNISVFMLFFGQIGWIFLDNLTDVIIIVSIVAGLLASRAFAWVIQNYAKTVVVPLVKIQQGDYAKVNHSVSYDKAGLVHVLRRDGVIDPVMARGAYIRDTFHKGEVGFIVGKSESFYLISKQKADFDTDPVKGK